MTGPVRCQNCRYSSRYVRQQPGEKPLYVTCCRAWMCAACREIRGCVDPTAPPTEKLARYHVPKSIPIKDGIYKGISDNDYHADRSSLSSSGARTILSSTPAGFLYERDHPVFKQTYEIGSAAHRYVLGVGQDIVGVNAKDWKTKAAQEEKAKIRQAGKVPLLKHEVDTAQAMAQRVRDHKLAAVLLEKTDDSAAEVSGYWHDDDTGTRLRFRYDWLTKLPNGRVAIVDYKTTVSANPDRFKRHAADYGYHQQDAWYRGGAVALGLSSDPAFLFIAQEKTPPYLVSVIELDAEDLIRGAALNRKAIEIYTECAAADTWPGYGDDVHHISLPTYSRYREEEQLA